MGKKKEIKKEVAKKKTVRKKKTVKKDENVIPMTNQPGYGGIVIEGKE